MRLVLSLLPALAAGSPVRDGVRTGVADSRLAAYRDNCRRIPSVTGRVIPEPVYDRASYEGEILARIARDVAPFDPDGVLRPEWTNARGAIARFDRGSIEIRVLDVQEHPAADVAIAELVRRSLAALLDERWVGIDELERISTDTLVALFDAAVREAERASVAAPSVLRALGFDERARTAGDVWAELRARLMPEPGEFGPALAAIESGGTLATRMTRRLEGGTDLREVARELADCLASGRPLS